jgi:preprotein translocase subunit SecA
MFSGIKNLFRARRFAPFQRQLQKINELSDSVAAYSDDQLQSQARTLRDEVLRATHGGFDLPESLRIRAFALAREAAQRTLHQRPYDVQMIGGLVIAHGAIAEMGTGEGKTLTAVSAAYANALMGRGVHVVTVNEYLARRDAVWMGQIYRMLGLSVSCLVPHAAYVYDPEWKIPSDTASLIDTQRDVTGNFLVQQDFLRPVSRREAYAADITYGTNHEFGFDYLRDHLAYSLTDQVQRGHAFAIIDEVDSILIDEARTPLIISAPDAQSSDFYKTFARIARTLVADVDYEVDEKFKSVRISESGISKVERSVGVSNLYAPENIRLVHYAEESLKAHALFHKDKDYVVKNGEIIIVDEFTGRLLQGRRYNGGLHQAIEAKEGVFVKEESRTYAKISIQNYFRLYKKISGMTGTASTSAEEFHKVYGLEVYTITSHVPSQRRDLADRIYKNQDAKLRAIVAEVRDRHTRGQPVLVGTASIAANEVISRYLHEAGVVHEVLNHCPGGSQRRCDGGD